MYLVKLHKYGCFVWTGLAVKVVYLIRFMLLGVTNAAHRYERQQIPHKTNLLHFYFIFTSFSQSFVIYIVKKMYILLFFLEWI